jgi:hypothetical protein
METIVKIVKYELFQVCQPNLVTPEYVVWRSERVNGGIVFPFAVTVSSGYLQNQAGIRRSYSTD